jgi:hypothetical protein
MNSKSTFRHVFGVEDAVVFPYATVSPHNDPPGGSISFHRVAELIAFGVTGNVTGNVMGTARRSLVYTGPQPFAGRRTPMVRLGGRSAHDAMAKPAMISGAMM